MKILSGDMNNSELLNCFITWWGCKQFINFLYCVLTVKLTYYWFINVITVREKTNFSRNYLSLEIGLCPCFLWSLSLKRKLKLGGRQACLVVSLQCTAKITNYLYTLQHLVPQSISALYPASIRLQPTHFEITQSS